MSPARKLKLKARLHRQIAVMRGRHARLDRFLDWIEDDRARLVRLPLAFLLILGGVVSFLPVLGFWMLPLGVLLLALDLPVLRGPVTHVTIRLRRRLGRWLHRRGGANGTNGADGR
ncbi:MAG: tryptophan synthase subunit beta [Rubellimicrobium sp.]|nr:tryptophan synthase subunit beta [Rubellimicrobium sp.]